MLEPWKMDRPSTVWRITVLGVGCVVQLLWGSAITYPLYANSLKAQFNFTERTVSLLPVFITLGRSLTPLPVAVLSLFGPVTSYLVGFVLSSGGFSLLWSSLMYKDWYQQYPAILYLYFFLQGHGGLYSYLTALPIIVKQFSGPHEGAVISLLEACYAASHLLTLGIYSQVFASDVPGSGEDDVAGYFLYKAISLSACSLLCLIFVRDFPGNGTDSSDSSGSSPGESITSEDIVIDEKSSLLQTPGFHRPASNQLVIIHWIYFFKHTLCSVFHWQVLSIMAAFCLAYPVCYGVEVNLASILKTSKLDSYLNILYFTFNISVIASRLAIGLLSDKLPYVPLAYYFAMVAFLATVVLVVAGIKPNNIVIIFSLVGIVGIYAGITKFVTLAVLARELGVTELARNFGICLFISPLLFLMWQWLMGGLYATAIDPDQGGDCYGERCFRWSYFISALLTAVSMSFTLLVQFL